MPYPRGTEKYRHYWEVRARGWSRKDAIAYAEAQSEAVAAETAGASADVPEDDNAAPEAPVIPEDWRELPWPDLRALAERVSDAAINSRECCERAIEAEINRRAG